MLTCTMLVVIGVLAVAALLIASPSAGNAQQLAKRQDQRHGAAYPGLPVPPKFAAAITATEDHRFGHEPLGIDPFGVIRALAAGLAGKNEGGATLYQQLAKLLYTPDRSGLAAEAEQVGVAIKLWHDYTSAQILQMYSDVAYFGNGFYGLAQASCGYFGITPARLTWARAALLAGLVLAPSDFDPLVHPVLGRAREVHVISRLVATGALSKDRAAAVLSVPLRRLLAPDPRDCRA